MPKGYPISDYDTATGYYGYVDGEYMLFDSEADYLECLKYWEDENA